MACPQQCSGHGLCLTSGTCKCEAGYAGDACDGILEVRENCNNHGTCIRKANNSYSCKCDSQCGGALCDEERQIPNAATAAFAETRRMCKKDLLTNLLYASVPEKLYGAWSLSIVRHL